MNRPLDNLGAYQLLRPLGAGGMAETFVAVRRGPAGFEQRVCLKRILPGCAADPTFVELFLDEARLLARLQCRNIVHVYDFGETEGTYYMALELVDGVDLEGLLKALRTRRVRMAPNVALYIIGEVLAALSYAHTLEIDGEPQHIVHRDISPSNILISKNGEVKLTDFGIAKARGRSHRTQTGHTKGKVAYMSPEQMRAEAVDGRSDLFAVGVVLFELLTGTHPFDANTDFALQLNIINGKRPPLRELLPSAPARVAQLVDALLATEAAQRPASAADAIALIPPLDSTFSLQRELQQLLATRSTGDDGPLATATPSQPVSGGALGYSATLSAPASTQGSEHASVAARHTTTSKPRTRLLRPIVWLTAAALVLALGYALGRGNKAEPPRAALPRAAPPPASLPTTTTTRPPSLPAAPASPLPAAALPRAPEAPAAAPAGAERSREERAVVPGKAVPNDAAPLRSRERKHTERRTNKSASAPGSAHAASAPSRPEDDAHGTAEKSTFVSATRPAPVEPASPAPERTPSAPAGQRRPGLDARAIIQAPRSDQPAKEASPRKAYVTPSGRVVIPAPPL